MSDAPEASVATPTIHRKGITAQVNITTSRTNPQHFQVVILVAEGARSTGRVLPGSFPSEYMAWLAGNHAVNEQMDHLFEEQRLHGRTG